MTEFLSFIQIYGGFLGLAVYIVVHDVLPFLRDKLWPEVIKDKKAKQIMRRETDEKYADLAEREVIAQEQIATNLILMREAVKEMETDSKEHDQRMVTMVTQITNTLSAMQSVLNVLLDRVTRPISNKEI